MITLLLWYEEWLKTRNFDYYSSMNTLHWLSTSQHFSLWFWWC